MGRLTGYYIGDGGLALHLAEQINVKAKAFSYCKDENIFKITATGEIGTLKVLEMLLNGACELGVLEEIDPPTEFDKKMLEFDKAAKDAGVDKDTYQDWVNVANRITDEGGDLWPYLQRVLEDYKLTKKQTHNIKGNC